MAPPRIPPIQGLLAFEALARLRSVTHAAEEMSVTPSAVSHRIRQMETLLAVKLFARGDFSLTPAGAAYLERVREAITALQHVPGTLGVGQATRLRLGVTPTFARQMLLPRIAQFRHAYPDIELQLQVSLPVHHMMAEEADVEVRFGTGHFPDRESVQLFADRITPVCSPEYLAETGPLDGLATEEAAARVRFIRCALEPWRTWFKAVGIAQPEPVVGSQFNDLGMAWDAAVAGFGVALLRLRAGQPWLESGQLVRLSRDSLPSPHDYFLCWKAGALERWECAAFVDWLRQALHDGP